MKMKICGNYLPVVVHIVEWALNWKECERGHKRQYSQHSDNEVKVSANTINEKVVLHRWPPSRHTLSHSLSVVVDVEVI